MIRTCPLQNLHELAFSCFVSRTRQIEIYRVRNQICYNSLWEFWSRNFKVTQPTIGNPPVYIYTCEHMYIYAVKYKGPNVAYLPDFFSHLSFMGENN